MESSLFEIYYRLHHLVHLIQQILQQSRRNKNVKIFDFNLAENNIIYPDIQNWKCNKKRKNFFSFQSNNNNNNNAIIIAFSKRNRLILLIKIKNFLKRKKKSTLIQQIKNNNKTTSNSHLNSMCTAAIITNRPTFIFVYIINISRNLVRFFSFIN